jgi:hemerythrin-like domain-containing protein
MSSQVSTWKDEHRTFSTLFQILEKQLKVFREDDTPNYDLMLEIVNYMLDYADRFHHPMEDLVFDIIAVRVPQVREKIWELKREHIDIAQKGLELANAINAVMGGTVISRDVVEDLSKSYLDLFRRHIYAEEQGVLMEAATKLTKEDWENIERELVRGEDPLFVERLDQRYSALRREIAILSP